MAMSASADAGFLETSGATSTGTLGALFDPPQKDLPPTDMLTILAGSVGVGPTNCCLDPRSQPIVATRQPNTHHLRSIRPSMAYPISCFVLCSPVTRTTGPEL